MAEKKIIWDAKDAKSLDPRKIGKIAVIVVICAVVLVGALS